jgi:probable lipoprotein NlpC
MKFLLLFTLIFLVVGAKQSLIFAAPLTSGFNLAPRASASSEEKAQAYSLARQRVIEAARRHEGVPYVYGGMTPRGLDCSGFIGLSFRDALGITIPRSASGLYSWSERIPYEKAQSGDFLFFRTGNTRSITHVAIYLGNRNFIHSASAGARTGVIISSLNENYWANTFAGAGRAFPAGETSTEAAPNNSSNTSSLNTSGQSRAVSDTNTSGASGSSSRAKRPNLFSDDHEVRFFFGAGFAPTWNGFIKDGDLIRGFSSQLLVGVDTHLFGMRMVFGFEVRQEYDSALGVFRLPVTFSWGPNEKIKIFAGPVYSFGNASLSIDDEQRYYTGGTSWLGTIGITAAPFTFKSADSEIAPYVEAAWQSYFSNNSSSDLAADFSAGFRFSTGIRWMLVR